MTKETMEEVVERLKEVKKAFVNVFSTHDGKEVLKALEREFDKPVLHQPDNTHMTYYNLGARDVLVYIKEIIDE